MNLPETGYSRLSEINVTPFVDVMLVLLVIFMVTAPMMVQGIGVDLPEAAAKEMTIEEDQIVVSITKSREIFIDGTDGYHVRLEELETKLRAIFTGRTDREVYLGADRDVPYGFVVSVMAAIQAAGIERLGMITAPLEEVSR